MFWDSQITFIVTFWSFVSERIYGVAVTSRSVRNYCTRLTLNLIKPTAYLHQQDQHLRAIHYAQHVSGITMPIIRSWRVLYIGCCLWYFVLWFLSCWSGVELRVMFSDCRMLLNMFRVSLCPSSGAQEYYTVVAACGISCCGFQVVGLVWSWVSCVRFAECCFTGLHLLSSWWWA